jgi:hypothetical protein
MNQAAVLAFFVAILTSASSHAWSQMQSRSTTTPDPRNTLAVTAPSAQRVATRLPKPTSIIAATTLADIGFTNGLRFANLGGRREVFVPLPQGDIATSNELVLVIDDISAHEARRSLEVLADDRSVVAIALDGKSSGRTVRIPLAKRKNGFLKLAFLYSGAATPDRCIDVRYVGDSVTIRPETAIESNIGGANTLDVATTVALMPRDVAVVLPERRLEKSEIAAALAVARAFLASGRRIRFHQNFENSSDLAKFSDSKRWTRGIVLVGPLPEFSGLLDMPVAAVAGPPVVGTIAGVRIGGMPALLVSDESAGRLLASPWLTAARGTAAASVGEAVPGKLATDRITFDQLGVAPAQAEVFGRADLTAAIDMRRLPTGTRPARLIVDVMVAPDGAGERAVVSVYVNERILGSTVAAINEPTRLDMQIPDGLIGTSANIRTVVQRRSAQGDCRFEPQGYPAQILGSSAFVIVPMASRADDFADLAARWAAGAEVWLPSTAQEQPTQILGLVASTLSALSPADSPVRVNLFAAGTEFTPTNPFIAVSERPPIGTTPRVRFDRGRVAVGDRSGRTLLDLGGLTGGAVVQIVSTGQISGLWIKPLSRDGALPDPQELKLDHGDVAFLDGVGVALAISTERDTLVRVNYPEQVSWISIAERMRYWIIGGLWLLATTILLFALQRAFRRRPVGSADE